MYYELYEQLYDKYLKIIVYLGNIIILVETGLSK